MNGDMSNMVDAVNIICTHDRVPYSNGILQGWVHVIEADHSDMDTAWARGWVIDWYSDPENDGQRIKVADMCKRWEWQVREWALSDPKVNDLYERALEAEGAERAAAFAELKAARDEVYWQMRRDMGHRNTVVGVLNGKVRAVTA